MTAPDRRPVGRPSTLPATQRLTVNLTADQIATARRLGNGNASEGVRKALLCQNPDSTGTSGTSGQNPNKNTPE